MFLQPFVLVFHLVRRQQRKAKINFFLLRKIIYQCSKESSSIAVYYIGNLLKRIIKPLSQSGQTIPEVNSGKNNQYIDISHI